jgi:hypothetical protein
VSHWIIQITLSEFRKRILNVKERLLDGEEALVWCGREGISMMWERRHYYDVGEKALV